MKMYLFYKWFVIVASGILISVSFNDFLRFEHILNQKILIIKKSDCLLQYNIAGITTYSDTLYFVDVKFSLFEKFRIDSTYNLKFKAIDYKRNLFTLIQVTNVIY